MVQQYIKLTGAKNIKYYNNYDIENMIDSHDARSIRRSM